MKTTLIVITSLAGLACTGAVGCDVKLDIDTGPLPGTCSKDADCDDKLPCTTDSCSSGKCATAPMKGYCLISKVCITDGTANPLNPCQKCDTTKTSAAWSDLANSATCDDKKPCTFSDTCIAGQCSGTAYSCDDKLTCTTESCNGKGPPAATGCSTVVSSTWCAISGACYATNAVNPADSCAICDPTKSQTAWSTKAGCTPTVKCGNGKKETGEECDGSVPTGTTCALLGFASGGTLKCAAKTCKLDTAGCTPKWAWAVSGGGKLVDNAYHLSVDSKDDIIIAGDVKCPSGGYSCSFGTASLYGEGEITGLVAKVSSTGLWYWAKIFRSSAAYPESRTWAVLPGLKSGYIAAGHFAHSTHFGSTNIKSNGDDDGFITKLDSFGVPSSPKGYGGKGSEEFLGAVQDAAGNLYLVGEFTTSTTFGTHVLKASDPSNNGESFVVKVDSNGKVLWATAPGGNSGEINPSIGIDSSGNTYLTASFTGKVILGSTTLTSRGSWDIYAAKLNSTGTFVSAVQAGATNNDMVGDIHVSPSGDVTIVGTFTTYAQFGSHTVNAKGTRDMFVASLDSGLKYKWAKSVGGAYWDSGTAVVRSTTGDIYLAGTFQGSLTVAGKTFTGTSSSEGVVVRLDSSGTATNALAAIGTDTIWPRSIALDKKGAVVIAGAIQGNAKFGTKTLTSKGNYDIFVAKIPRM